MHKQTNTEVGEIYTQLHRLRQYLDKRLAHSERRHGTGDALTQQLFRIGSHLRKAELGIYRDLGSRPVLTPPLIRKHWPLAGRDDAA